MEPEGSFPCSQQPATGAYAGPEGYSQGNMQVLPSTVLANDFSYWLQMAAVVT